MSRPHGTPVRRSRVPLRLLLALVALVVVGTSGALVRSATGGGPTLLSRLDPHREWAVAGDADASVDDVVGVGVPVAAVARGSRTLVSWRAEPDDDEGANQAVWRLYDGRGGHVAEGRLGLVSEQGAIPDLFVVPDGFLLRTYTDGSLRHITPDGTVARVPTSSRRLPAQPGDVLLKLWNDAGLLAYHPADRTAHRLPALPVRNPQGLTLDARGTLWVLEEWTRTEARISSSPGGGGPWTRTTVPLPRRGSPMAIGVAGDRVVVPVGTMARGAGFPTLRSVWTHPVEAPSRAGWAHVPTSGLHLASTLEAGIAGLGPEGGAAQMVLSDERGGVFVEQDGGFRRADLPSGAVDTSVRVSGTTMFLTGSRDHRLYRSDDAGRTWRTVAR